jgi:hypothetical protein
VNLKSSKATGMSHEVDPPPLVVLVDCVVFCLPRPVVIVDSVGTGIGEVGEAMETDGCAAFAAEVSSPLESEPQPANPASSTAAASAGSVFLIASLVMKAGFVASPEGASLPGVALPKTGYRRAVPSLWRREECVWRCVL